MNSMNIRQRNDVATHCAHCREEFVPGDYVVVMSNGDVIMHRNCAIRGVIGSVAHVLRICSCFVPGSTEGDPPELTKREAADFAVELWEYEKSRNESTCS